MRKRYGRLWTAGRKMSSMHSYLAPELPGIFKKSRPWRLTVRWEFRIIGVFPYPPTLLGGRRFDSQSNQEWNTRGSVTLRARDSRQPSLIQLRCMYLCGTRRRFVSARAVLVGAFMCWISRSFVTVGNYSRESNSNAVIAEPRWMGVLCSMHVLYQV